MTTLYIRQPARADGEHALAQFALVADGGSLIQQGEGALKGMGDVVAASRHVVLLLAAADVTLLHVKVPPLSNARLKAALPGLVEEHVLGDPDDCVLVAAPTDGADGLRTVAVAQRGWLAGVVKSLLAQGARAVSALPAQLCLPILPGNAAAAIGPGGITLRHGLFQGLGLAVAGEPESALQTVRALAGDAPLTLYVPPAQLGEFQVLLAEAAVKAEHSVMLEPDHWAHWIAGSKTTHFDLVPGLGAAGAQTRDWQRWRWPIRLAILTVVVNVVALNYEWFRMKKEADTMRESMRQIYRAAYPKETVFSSDLALQMRQKIALAKASRGQVNPEEFTYQAAAFGEAARGLPRVPELASLAYRDSAMTVKPKAESADPAAGGQLKTTLAARGLELTDPGNATWVLRSKGGKR